MKMEKCREKKRVVASPDRLWAGLLNLEVLILDDKLTHYMNIDRDRLREGAVSEKELLEASTEMLKRWFIYFCNEEENKTQKYRLKKGKTAGKKEIEQEYRSFIDKLFSVLFENREYVLETFKEG